MVTASAPLAAAVGAEAIRSGGKRSTAPSPQRCAETAAAEVRARWRPDRAQCASRRAGAGRPHRHRWCPGRTRGGGGGRPAARDRAVVGRASGRAGRLPGAGRARHAATRPPGGAGDRATRDGFAWAPISTALTHEAAALLRDQNPAGTVYLPDDRPISPGALVTLPGLALALEELVAGGGAVLHGALGAALIEAVRRRGGTLTTDDLESVRAEWVPAAPVRRALFPFGPPQRRRMAHRCSARSPGSAARRSAAVWDAVLAAIARQRESLGDPAVPSGTSAVSAADADGNAVVVVHSNSYPRFGSGIVVDGFDLVLNNRAGAVRRFPDIRTSRWRATSGHHAPRMGGGRSRRPPSSSARRRAAPTSCPGTRLLADVFGGELRPGVLVTAPRWEWLPAGDGVVVEEDLGADAMARCSPA